ncbi:MAG: S-layer homology domain-containing protein [Oscillospiraceae bacterium]|nr:S-layer homology domain-containing protein [Oscillospiraceae bacterium]
MKRSVALFCALLLCAASSLPAQAVEWPPSAAKKEPLRFVPVNRGEIVEFSARELELRLGMERGELCGATLVFPPREGRLMLDGVQLPALSPLSREELDRLCYVPEEETAQTGFSLLAKGEENIFTSVEIQVLESPNSPPQAKNLSLSALAGLPLCQSLPVADPEGGAVTTRLTSQPAGGLASLSDGVLQYRPYPGFTGHDSLSYVAVDELGGISEEGFVAISVEESPSGIVFCDALGSPCLGDAVRLHQAGILCGEQIGGAWFFHPEDALSRGEFLTAVLAACGSSQSQAACVNTGLKNDAALPFWAKPYVKSALEKGILREDIFLWEAPLTRAQAVVLLQRACGIDDVKQYSLSFSDQNEIPAWAAEAYQNLAAHGLLGPAESSARPNALLTRADAASLLWQLYLRQNS